MKRKNQLTLIYSDGTPINFTRDGWTNATQIGAKFGKKPNDWLRLPKTVRYIDRLCEKYEARKSRFVCTIRGGNTALQGTYLNPIMSIKYTDWVDLDLSIWCETEIVRILREGEQWQDSRKLTATGFKLATDAMNSYLIANNLPYEQKYFIQLAYNINRAFCGSVWGVDRNTLSIEELKMLEVIEFECARLIIRMGGNFKEENRKVAACLVSFVENSPELSKIRHQRMLAVQEQKALECLS